MSYIIRMTHNEFSSLPPYDKKTAEAGKHYRLFKKGLYNLQTSTGYTKKITEKYGSLEKGTVHKVYISTNEKKEN